MDPFDEFEFKPLTEGLGFHKKTVSLKEGLRHSGVLDEELSGIPAGMPDSLLIGDSRGPAKRHTFEDVISSLEKTPLSRAVNAKADLEITEPLPRLKAKLEAMDIQLPLPPSRSPFPQPAAYKAPAAIKKTPTQTEQAAVGTRRGAADSPAPKLQAVPVSFASVFLDGIIVTAVSIVFLIALLSVTKVDLSAVTHNLTRENMTKVSLIALLMAVMQMYVIIARSFFGRTLGEWTFDMQLGLDNQQNLESYPLRVAYRCLINMVTGLVLLPLLSAILDRDLAGQFTGVKLYRQRV